MNYRKPLTVFVHIPKTAGSTVNSYLRKANQLGEDHIEAWIDDDLMVAEKIEQLAWVSGHVPICRMHERLSTHSSRALKYYALLRNPTRQIMSHYNWLIEIYHRGEHFYNQHPLRIKSISEEIRSTDNSDPRCIIKQLEKHAGLFLNQQSRMVLGDRALNPFSTTLASELERYQIIAVEEHIAHFVHQLSGLRYSPRIQKNVSKYHFDRLVFYKSELSEFLVEKNWSDFKLYELVRGENAKRISRADDERNRRRFWFIRR